MSIPNVRELIAVAESEGIRIRLNENGRLQVRGSEEVVTRWLERLAEAKEEIASILAVGSTPPPTNPEDAQGTQGAQPAGVRSFVEMGPFCQPDGLADRDALKGYGVLLVLDSTGERCWIVADEEDAATLGTVDGAVFTRKEIQILVAIADPDVREEVMRFKQALPGRLRHE